MSEQHEVTVYDRVPATAAVSVDQMEHYLARKGWRQTTETIAGGRVWVMSGHAAVFVYPQRIHADEIERVAEVESRQPSVVLADIAAESA